MGRDVKFNAKKKKALCEALSKAMPLNYAADLVGVARQTVYDHMDETKGVYDEDFCTQVRIAKAEAIKGLIALTGKQNGAWKLLKNLAKGEFTDVHKSIHVGGDEEEDHPIKLIVEDYRMERQDD